MSFTEHYVMLRTSRILIPCVVICLTILGLAVIFNGGRVDVQAGEGNRIHIEGLRKSE